MLLWLELLVGEARVRRRLDVMWLVGINGASAKRRVGVVGGASGRVAAGGVVGLCWF